MKNILLIFLFTTLTFCVYSQGSIKLENALINVENNAYMNVNGDVTIENATSIENNGAIYLNNNWINNSGTIGLVNNGTGSVAFRGDNQEIKGNDETQFHDLVLVNNMTVKSFIIDCKITNNLDLTDAILELNTNYVHLTNQDPNSLSRNSGFISGQNLEGYFLRSTNANSTYSFPVGNINLDDHLRVAEVIPTSSDSSVFGVRLGALSPGSESGASATNSVAPFDINFKETNLGNLNENYFHTINRMYGTTDANASIYFYTSDFNTNSVVNTVGKWNTINNEWQNNNFTVTNVALPSAQQNFANKVATSKNVLSYEDDVYTLSELELVFPTGFTPGNSDGFNDFFIIDGLDQFPDNEIEIYNRWGEKVFGAKPYLNNWDGVNTSNGIKLQGSTLQDDTYFYILKLDENSEPIKRYLELVR